MLWHAILGDPKIIVRVDGVIAPAVAHEIERACQAMSDPLSTTEIAQLKTKFSVIARTTSAYEGKKLVITITGIRPLVLANDTIVIDDKADMHNVGEINPALVATLKKMHVKNNADILTQEFKKFIGAADSKTVAGNVIPALFDNYVIDWQSPYLIYLTPITDGAKAIIRFDVVPTPQQFALGQCALADTKKKLAQATIDFRFNGQLIIGEQKALA
jgi:hypothetical protein